MTTKARTIANITATAMLLCVVGSASGAGLTLSSDNTPATHRLSLRDISIAGFIDAFGKHHDLAFIGEPELAESERVVAFYETPQMVINGEQEPLQHFAPLLQMAGFDLCPLEVTHDDAVTVHTDKPLRIVAAASYELRMIYPPSTVTAGKHVDTWLGNDVRAFPSACRDGLPPGSASQALPSFLDTSSFSPSSAYRFTAALPPTVTM